MSSPPPPPYSPPPQPDWNQPPPAPQGWNQPPPAPAPQGWNQFPAAPPAYEVGSTGKPPRPKVQVAAILTIVGGVLIFVGDFLPWLRARGTTLNGTDSFFTNSDGELKIVKHWGNTWIVFAIILIGLGIALYAAGRILAVAIIGIVMAAIALFLVLAGIGFANDTKDLVGEGTLGAGLFVGVVGSLLALGGSIAATAKRRR